ncbi:MAG: MvaI/BcnI family restriction endonuclease [Myxococcota bacterium]
MPQIGLFPITLDAALRQLRELGARRVLAKPLAANDNSKNQVYLGPNFSALQVLPTGHVTPDAQKPILKAPLRWAWVDEGLAEAPRAQLILYPQYPEVRLSGFLTGCARPPSDVMTSRDPNRVLLLGLCDDGRILARAAAAGSLIAREVLDRGDLPRTGVFLVVAGDAPDARRLVTELRRIHAAGWIPGKKRQANGTISPYRAQNAGGYTLEAELGISPNGHAEPDFDGWEVKQFGGTVITLLTPEPTGGDYRTLGVEDFVRRYGYADTRGRPDRLNFGGIFRVGERAERTGLTLRLRGFADGVLRDPHGAVCLVDDEGREAASWSLSGLLDHWKHKHALAAYVPSERREPGEYRYGPVVALGYHTDPLRLLDAFARGAVYYDPGIKLEGASAARPEVKRRSQFRVRFADVGALYERLERVDLR